MSDETDNTVPCRLDRMLLDLAPLARTVLATLPTEPLGASIDDLADDLLGDRSPTGKSQVAAAVNELIVAMGGLHMTTGRDGTGRPDAHLYGVRQLDYGRVHEHFRRLPPPWVTLSEDVSITATGSS